jgi:hypothetical protein
MPHDWPQGRKFVAPVPTKDQADAAVARGDARTRELLLARCARQAAALEQAPLWVGGVQFGPAGGLDPNAVHNIEYAQDLCAAYDIPWSQLLTPLTGALRYGTVVVGAELHAGLPAAAPAGRIRDL